MVTARLTLDPHFTVGAINRRLFGSFVEHLGRCVYDGIYEPGHPTADEDGFRGDVIELVNELGVTHDPLPRRQLRLGVPLGGQRRPARGPPAPARPRLALDRDQRDRPARVRGWLDKVDSELMLAVNLGTRGALEALDLLEYANIRVRHDAQRPADRERRERPVRRHDVVPRQRDGRPVAARSPHRPTTTARSPRQTAKAMRQLDPSLELVVCGSSSAQMPTFGEWERVVLEHTYDDVDYISCHAYYEEHDGDLGSFLASARRHGPLHRVRRRHGRPREGRCCGSDKTHQHLVRRVERLVHRALPGRSTRSPASTTGPSPRACSRTSTRSPTPSCSAACSSRC